MAELLAHLTRLASGLCLAGVLAGGLGCTVAPEAQTGGGEPPVSVTNLPARGGFVVRNRGAATVSLSRDVLVERQSPTGWTSVQTTVALMDRCEVQKTDACVGVPAGGDFKPVPWNGFSCGSQCPAACRANVYQGPGTFRFVAQSCDRAQRIIGPTFDLPAEGK